jgi:nucleotide-binding universal stress UspA family protein
VSVKSILLFAPADSARPDRGAPACAIGLAKAHRARLTVFSVALDVTTPGHRADAPQLAQEICDAAQAAGVDCVTVTEHSHAIGVHEAVAEHARLHDLTVAGADQAGLLSERLVTEYLLFDSGRPVLLVPAGHTAPYAAGPVAVAWDNTASASRALGDAIALLEIASARLLTIQGEKALRTDLEADAICSTMERRGVSATPVSAGLDGRSIAGALQEEAMSGGASLLVMGAFAHSRLRRFVLGSATADLLKHPRLPVLLSH